MAGRQAGGRHGLAAAQGHLPGCLSCGPCSPAQPPSHSGLVKDHAGQGKADLPKWDLSEQL